MAVDFWAENLGALKRRIEAAIVEDMLLTQRSDDIMTPPDYVTVAHWVEAGQRAEREVKPDTTARDFRPDLDRAYMSLTPAEVEAVERMRAGTEEKPKEEAPAGEVKPVC